MKKKQKAPERPIASRKTPSSKASTKLTEAPSKSIRIERDFPVPPDVRRILQLLNQKGHIAYLVGGCVRDWLLAIPPKDLDLVTSALPEELESLFPDALEVGKSFGVFRVPMNPQRTQFIEIATFRKDLEYTDFRHPTAVEFSDPIEDASRRDFTINALFYDVRTKTIIDYVGGTEDLKAKTLRAIGHPSQRFKEDALRLIRAVRFAVRLGFTIESETLKAIQMRAALIEKVSTERIRDELNRIITGPRPGDAIQLLVETQLFVKVLPELNAWIQSPQKLKKSLGILNGVATHLPQRSTSLTWAALLRDFENPRKLGERLKFSNLEIETLEYFLTHLPKFKEVYRMREATLIRWISHPLFTELLELYESLTQSENGNLIFAEFCRSRLKELARERDKNPGFGNRLITGEDLIQMGLSPGPLFSEILQTVEDLSLEKRLQTKEDALEFVVKYFVS